MTPARIEQIARECGFPESFSVQKYTVAIRNEALEEAAKACDNEWANEQYPRGANYCAAAIRRLKETV